METLIPLLAVVGDNTRLILFITAIILGAALVHLIWKNWVVTAGAAILGVLIFVLLH